MRSLLTDRVREEYKVTKGKRTFELGVTAGLLKMVKSEGELAFILGHELTHLFEAHTDAAEDNEDAFKGWWSSQRHEVIADNRGLQMILGHYNLDSAISVLKKLAELSPDKNPVFTALGSHHDEGVRIGSAQSYAEYLRRTDAKAQVTTDSKLPDFVHFNAFAREPFAPDLDALKASHLPQFINYFADPKVWRTRALMGDDDEPALIEKFKEQEPSTSQRAAFLVDVVNMLSASTTLSPQQKVDTFLRISAWMAIGWEYGWRPPTAYSALDIGSLSKIERFLLTNANKGWTPEKFVEEAMDKKKGAVDRPGTISYYLQRAVLEKGGKKQLSFLKLARVSPTWRRLLTQMTDLAFKAEPGSLRNFIVNNGGGNWGFENINGALSPTMREEILKAFDNYDLKTLATKVHVSDYDAEFLFPEMYKLKNAVKDDEKVDKAFIGKVHGKFEPYLADYVKARNEFALKYLNAQKFKKINQLTQFLGGFFDSFEISPLEPDSNPALVAALAKTSKYVFEKQALSSLSAMDSDGFRLFMAKAFSSPVISKTTKADLFQLYITSVEYTYLRSYVDPDTETSKGFQDYLSTISVKELLERMRTIPPSVLKEINKAAKADDGMRVRELGEAMTASRVGILVMLGIEYPAKPELASRYSKADFDQILEALAAAKTDHEKTRVIMEEPFNINEYGTKFLFQVFKTHQAKYQSAAGWLDAFEQIYNTNILGLDQDASFKPTFQETLTKLIAAEPKKNILTLLKRPQTL
ncbi:MAG: hypothetical protein EOP05_08945, partial [Proteobacteria bacterium]